MFPTIDGMLMAGPTAREREDKHDWSVEADARERGFTELYLDTKDDLLEAIRFYERRGYERVPRYNDNPQATIFMRRVL